MRNALWRASLLEVHASEGYEAPLIGNSAVNVGLVNDSHSIERDAVDSGRTIESTARLYPFIVSPTGRPWRKAAIAVIGLRYVTRGHG